MTTGKRRSAGSTRKALRSPGRPPVARRGYRRVFERLKDAYVKARYSRRYVIEAEELAWLGERVSMLRDLVKAACAQRLAEF